LPFLNGRVLQALKCWEERHGRGEKRYKTPHFTDIYFDSIYCTGANTAISITGLPEMPINKIYFKNLIIIADKGFEATDAADLYLNNVKSIAEKKTSF
jgi:hypothetical protein